LKYSIIYISLLLSIAILNNCKRSRESPFNSEGEIHYEISYIENGLDKISTDMLPNKMVTKYRGENYSFDIEGFFGLFVIENIVNPKLSKNFTLLNVLNKKFYYQGELNEPAVGFGLIPEMNIEFTEETKYICGIECKKALAIFPFAKKSNDTLEIFYTSEIPIPNPNRTTPYRKIDGVLMEFYLELPNLKMKLTANAVYKKNIAIAEFVKPDGYKEVSRAYLETVLYKLMDPE